MIGEVTHNITNSIFNISCIIYYATYLQDGYIVQAKWPNALGDGVVNELAIEEIQYVVKVTHEFRVRLKKMISIKEKVSVLTIIVSFIETASS